MNILDYIPKGRENAISKEKLCQITGLGDRVVRNEIAKARRDVAILNLQDGRGYFIPTTVEEVDTYIKQEEHRAKSIFVNLKGAKKYRSQIKGQMKLFV